MHSFTSLPWDLYKKGSNDTDVWQKARQSNCEDHAYDDHNSGAPFVQQPANFASTQAHKRRNFKSVYIMHFRRFSLLEEIVSKLSVKVICIPGYNCFFGLLTASNCLSDVMLIRPFTTVILAIASIILNT